jgi:hypothetical protein
VEVDVKDLLHGRLAVRQKEIHAFTPDTTLPQCTGEPLGQPEHVSTCPLVQIGEKGSVAIGDHEDVSRIDGLDVHKRCAEVVSIDDARLLRARQDIAEYAITH